MSREEIIQSTIDAIARAVEEHGAPNSFTPGELHLYYGGPAPDLQGSWAAHMIGSIDLDDDGHETNVHYERGRPCRWFVGHDLDDEAVQ